MSGTDITIDGPDGSFSGYLAKPESGTGPGIVVIQEIFGVNDVMRGICDGLAREGFITLCPDLFWRLEPGIRITDKTDEELAKAFDLFGKFDVDKGIVDIGAALKTLRGVEGCTGKAGAVGYCLGGLLAFLTATRTDSDASVGYYGVNIHEKLDEQPNIKKPLMLHIAGKDEFVPPAAQDKITAGLKDHPLVTLYAYPDQEHAFARDGGKHFDKQAAVAANERTLAFFQENLG